MPRAGTEVSSSQLRRRVFQLPIACLAALALGSCSYVCDLLAVAIDGRLAFIVDPSSDSQPDCIASIDVQAAKGEPKAEPAKGDDRLMVINGGSYWKKTFNLSTCVSKFPIFYGAHLDGEPFVYSDGERSSVEAKPLRVGALYEVSTSGDGVYGNGWFRITSDLRIENYREDLTPPTTNEKGYDITDYANYVSQAENRIYMP